MKSPVVIVAVEAIRWYQRAISPLLGPACRYEPTCSHYTLQAIERFGAARGIWLGARRLLRCQPWSAGGYDPVPEAPDLTSIRPARSSEGR